MATNKHASIRYQALDKCLRNPGRRYYIDDLIEACNRAIYEFAGIEDGVKRRQVLEDIKYMESDQGWSAPIEHFRDGKRVFFRYEDLKFSINNQPLNDADTNTLKEAILTLSRFKGLPQFDWVDEMTTRMHATLGGIHKNEKIIDFEQNEFLAGTAFISSIYNAILYKRTLKIQYRNFINPEKIKITYHPWYLKEFKNRWFVFGWNGERNQLTNLALDRICEMEEISIPYIQNTAIDFTEYFEDIIGVTVYEGRKTEKILLKIKKTLYPYIKTKPMHGSQIEKGKDENHVFIELTVIPNVELESLILSYGESIEIVQPAFLREKIINRITDALDTYKQKSG